MSIPTTYPTGLGGRIRTCGPLRPRQVRYQTALHLVILAILARLKLASPLRQRGVISIHYKTVLVCQKRIELLTVGLRDRCSTTELLAHIGAEDGGRTHDIHVGNVTLYH